MLGGNRLNCFKATQVLGGPTQILIWGYETAKSPQGGPMNPNDAMHYIYNIYVSRDLF